MSKPHIRRFIPRGYSTVYWAVFHRRTSPKPIALSKSFRLILQSTIWDLYTCTTKTTTSAAPLPPAPTPDAHA